jgi:TonB family protein
MLVSALIHTVPVAAWVVIATFPAEPPPQKNTEYLNLELFGMLGKRQVEERKEVAQAAPVIPKAAPQPKSAPKQPKPKKPSKPEKKPSHNAVPVLPSQAQEEPPQAAALPAASLAQEAQTAQVQQTISLEQQELAKINRYANEIRKLIKDEARRQYPLKAKFKAWTGKTQVVFTLDEEGRLVPGSDSVQKSSGHTILDDAALKAIHATDFPKPPLRAANKPMMVEIIFEIDRR